MRYAIMSDVHAYLPALEKVIADARSQSVDRLVMLGDMVGKGPSNPHDVLELCMRRFDLAVIGNQEVDYISRASGSTDRRDLWLRSLPDLEVEGDLAFTHRGLSKKNGKMIAGFGYTFDPATAQVSFDAMDESIRIAFIGHTHESIVWGCDASGQVTAISCDVVTTDPTMRYIVNVGSVGYPRSEDKSSYVVYDSDSRLIIFRRLEFDFESYRTELELRGIEIPAWLSAKMITR